MLTPRPRAVRPAAHSRGPLSLVACAGHFPTATSGKRYQGVGRKKGGSGQGLGKTGVIKSLRRRPASQFARATCEGSGGPPRLGRGRAVEGPKRPGPRLGDGRRRAWPAPGRPGRTPPPGDSGRAGGRGAGELPRHSGRPGRRQEAKRSWQQGWAPPAAALGGMPFWGRRGGAAAGMVAVPAASCASVRVGGALALSGSKGRLHGGGRRAAPHAGQGRSTAGQAKQVAQAGAT
jgi:hypothetical protein